jgi:preprotein translocase subunit SecE
MVTKSPAEFAREVRRETAKVTWPSRKETFVTTGMVFLMVVMASIFFLIVDQIMAQGVRLLLGVGA